LTARGHACLLARKRRRHTQAYRHGSIQQLSDGLGWLRTGEEVTLAGLASEADG
jgi:hypothetical protein